jgi:hypothetical protein
VSGPKVKPPSVPSVCQTCRFAQWEQTANGRRHPNGSGTCLFQFPDSPLPKWFRERSYVHGNPELASLREYFEQRQPVRYISWLDNHRIVAAHCATHEAKP